MQGFLQQTVAGLATGSIYALIGLGFTLVWKSMALVNFAQGDLFMLGAMLGFTLYAIVGLPLPLVVLGTLILCFVVGAILQHVAIRPLKHASPMNLLLATIALSIFLQNVSRQVWGADALPFPTFFAKETVYVGPVSVRTQDVVIIGATLVSVALFHAFFRYTRMGKAMRASAIDPRAATIVGIDTTQMARWTFGISAALGGLAGVLIAPVHFITPTMGSLPGLKAFTAAVVGGLDNVYGALVGGILIGLLETFAAAYLSSAYRDVIAFVILLLMLRYRPLGLLGTRVIEKV